MINDKETITLEEALQFMQEAQFRLTNNGPQTLNRNSRGGKPYGGAYWRLAKVLRCFLEPQLVSEEGKEHAEFLVKQHGKVRREGES